MHDAHATSDAARRDAIARDAALERFAQRAFMTDIDRIDAETRARLASARERALDAMRPRTSAIGWRMGPMAHLPSFPAWAAGGACAAALVLAVAFALRLAPADDATRIGAGPVEAPEIARATPGGEVIELLGPAAPLVSPADLELLAGGDPDVLDVLEEDLEFYAWLEQQPELAATDGGRPR